MTLLPTVVWGTGNVGRAAIRAVAAHPALDLTAVLVQDPAKVGRDAGRLAGLDHELGLAAVSDPEAVLADRPAAVVYACSGDVRPDAAVADIVPALRAGCAVVTPSLYAMYDPTSAPPALREPLEQAALQGGGALFVSGIDPGWGNDVLPVLMAGLCQQVEQVRCQEIFDYSTYDAPDAVRLSVGMGLAMDQVPMMVAPGVPTMVWGGQLRLMARALGARLDDIVERVERRALDADVTNGMGMFERGTQGGLRFEVQGIVDGRPRLVVEHVTRIAPEVAPDWPSPTDGGAGAHVVHITGRPNLTVTVSAEDEGGNRAAGGNATAVGRLVGAIPWLRLAPPGVYDALDVPLAHGTMTTGRP